MFAIYETKEFQEQTRRWSSEELERIMKVYLQLRENPYVGKPIRYSFLREKKIGGKRIYYLIYEKQIIVLLVGASEKKNQQERINEITRNLAVFRDEAERLSKPPA